MCEMKLMMLLVVFRFWVVDVLEMILMCLISDGLVK